MLRRRKKPVSQDIPLQITSLADIFIIILVFLIKTFSSTATAINIKSDLMLPPAIEADPVITSLKVEISSQQIILENDTVLALEQFKLPVKDLEADGSSRSLNTAFINFVKSSDKSLQPERVKLLIMADENAPYGTLSSVFSAASRVGILDYKLVVMEEQ